MPSIKDLERFQRDLIALAREDEVLARWGETRESLAPPTQDGLPPSSPPPKRGAKPSPPRSRAVAAEPEMPPDFASLLAQVPEGEAVEELGADATGASEGSIDAELEALLAAPEPGEEAAAGERLEALDGFDLGAFAGAIEEDETLEPTPAEEPPPSSEELPDLTATDLEASDFEATDFGAMDLEGESATETGEPGVEDFEAGSTAAPAATESIEVEGEDFSMPEFGEFELPSLDEETPLAGAPVDEAPAEEASIEEAPVEEAPFEEEPIESATSDEESALPSADEDFSIPSFEATSSEEVQAESPELGDFSGFELPEAPSSGDAFDAFSFGEPPSPELAGDALDRELASLGTETEEASTFNLDGGWGSMGAEEEAAPAEVGERPAPKQKEAKPQRPVLLTEAQVDRLQDRLLALPLNLRMAIEDIVGNEKGSEALRTDIVWMLVESATIQDIAAAAGKVLRRRISIPEGYVRRTGAGYLAEKGSLRYLFIHTVLPILRTALIALAVVGVLGFLGYRLIWRPIVATQIYREGYQRIQQGRYPEAEDAFARASSIREFVIWYYRYAQAYADRRLWIYAENKYEALMRAHPNEKAGALDWARLEQEQLKYREGIDILNKWILDRKNIDPDALLLEGDIFLEWADEDPTKYEEARRRYAALIQYHGAKDLYLERMLLYFMRTDNLAEVLPLKDRFIGMANDPLSASTLAELGGFLLDHKEMTDDFRILKAAVAKDPRLPEVHWQLHRYYQLSGDRSDELKALDNAIAGFERIPALGKRRLSMYLDALIRRGDMGVEDRQYLRAEPDYGKAVVAYQNGLDIGRLKPTTAFARAWAGLGDVAYLAKDDLDSARSYYEKAADNGWDNPEIRYRRGFIAYRQGRFADALEQFWTSKRGGNDSPFLEWALDSTFARRGDWNAAVSGYQSLVDKIGDLFDALDYPQPQDKLYDRNVTELLMESQNNLGVALFRLGDRTGNPRLKAKSVAAFTESARLFDLLVHDARSLVGANSANLGYANLDYVLHPRRGIDLSAYEGIQKDDSWIAP